LLLGHSVTAAEREVPQNLRARGRRRCGGHKAGRATECASRRTALTAMREEALHRRLMARMLFWCGGNWDVSCVGKSAISASGGFNFKQRPT